MTERKKGGRPKSNRTEVIAVRISEELRERLDLHLDRLETRHGVKSSRSALTAHALQTYLDSLGEE